MYSGLIDRYRSVFRSIDWLIVRLIDPLLSWLIDWFHAIQSYLQVLMTSSVVFYSSVSYFERHTLNRTIICSAPNQGHEPRYVIEYYWWRHWNLRLDCIPNGKWSFWINLYCANKNLADFFLCFSFSQENEEESVWWWTAPRTGTEWEGMRNLTRWADLQLRGLCVYYEVQA